MTFCSHCGAQLEPNEHFCVKCGTAVAGAAAPVPAPVAAAPIPAQPYIPAPPAAVPHAPAQSYPAYPPGPVPVPMPVEPKRSNMATWIVVAVLALGGYYYYTTHQGAAPAATPPAATPPAGSAPAPGTPPPAANPGAAPESGTNAALTKLQVFTAHWDAVNGFISISNAQWKNTSTVTIQSANLECDQFDAKGTDLDEMQTTLNGPVPAGDTFTFPTFQMGAVAANLDHVTCSIMHIKQPTGQ